MKRTFLAVLLALAWAGAAFAQSTPLAAPSIIWGGQVTSPTPTVTIGYDSVTGFPCIVGSVATCSIPTSGATGGGAVYGPTAKGSPAANPPVVMGGTADGTAAGNVTVAKVDTSGNLSVAAITTGAAPSGAAVSGNPVLVAGSDGTNARTALTDASGHFIITGVAGLPVPVGGNIASGGSDSGNPVKVGGVASTTVPTTATTGQRKDLWLSANGAAIIAGVPIAGADGASNTFAVMARTDTAALSLSPAANHVFNGTNWDRTRSLQGIDGTGLGVTAVEEGGASFSNITTATTTTVKSGAGTLHKLCINTYVASGTITIYNNTTATGAKIGTVTNPATLLAEGPNCAVYDVYFSTGLTIVTTGAQDITAIYR